MTNRLWRPRLGVALIFASAAFSEAQERPAFQQPAIKVPLGYTVELAAGPPLVEHPIMAGFDERGRLFVAENAGVNLQRPLLEEQLPNSILRLEDTDGDGKFDKRTVFADKLTFPQGALWHEGWLYSAVSGAIWRFQDQDDDGVAETRQKIVGSFGYTGNAADVHGCFLGPEGRIYWCEGRHGHDIVDKDGKPVSKGKAARIFSCRADGSDVQTHCGGGMDNPVEIDWTAEGEMLGTVNILYDKRGDCLVHWMHGGVYPREDQPAVLAEFRRTGDLLGAVHDYGHVAVSGCCWVRGAGVSPALNAAATLLVTEFNTHKVLRTDLYREGATFRAQVSEFLQAASDDFHPTDVLEDADGSILVVDTGGWFRIGCPASQVAKPNVLGAIYRVRPANAKIDDPRGLKLQNTNELDPSKLVALLGDERPAVRERAMSALVRLGNAALPVLSRALVHKSAAVRQAAIWTLARIDTPEAAGVIRLIGLADKDPAVLAAATYAAGALRDTAAVSDLCKLLDSADTPPQIARNAATALGQIGAPAAVPALLDALRRGGDRVLEHALIYALIEIKAEGETVKGLASADPRVRRAALIALDQMPGGNLTREQVAPLLDTADERLLAAAMSVIGRHPGWSDELIALATKLLDRPALSEDDSVILGGALVALAKDERVQALIGSALSKEGFHSKKLGLLIDVTQRSDLSPWPATWLKAIQLALLNRAWDDEHLVQALNALGASSDASLDDEWLRVSRSRGYPSSIRLAALGAVVRRLPSLAVGDFDFLRQHLANEREPGIQLAAARALAAAKLSDVQRLVLTEDLAKAGPLEIRTLWSACSDTKDVLVGRKLIAAIHAAPGKQMLTYSEVLSFLEQFAPDVRGAAPRQSLFGISAPVDLRRLGTIERELPAGGPMPGRQVFFGRKAACGSCHQVGAEGGKVGPDLSKVGERRNLRDLLEAVVLPSSSLARGFESHAVRTHDGQTITGLVVRETPESVFLRTLDQRELRLRRGDIDQMQSSPTSIMPAGLENALSRQELADLLAYLQSLK